jgi:hypothetical protein
MLPFKSSDKIMKEYATEYKKFKIIDLKGLDILTGSGVSEGVCNYIDSKNKYTYYYSLQTRIESVLELLDWECSMFLKKEFFGYNNNKFWWQNYYSRSTYYRLKKKYMDNFLVLFYA